jgi:D-xylose ABC transporter substrate-binding protein
VIPQDAESAAKIVELAHSSGIKVISYDRLIKNSDVDFYISFDNVKVGELQAKEIINNISEGKFAYIGGPLSDNNALMLREGSMNILQPKIDSGDIEIVLDSYSENWETEVAYKTVSDFLKFGGTIDAIVAANDGVAAGSILALEEYDLEGKIPVSGQDASLNALHNILEGTQTMTVYKPIKNLAKEAAKLAISIVKGNNIITNNVVFNGKINVSSLLLDVVSVTSKNINETVVADGFHKEKDVYQ